MPNPFRVRRPVDRSAARSNPLGQHHTTASGTVTPDANKAPASAKRTVASVAVDQRIRSALRGMGIPT